MLEDLIEEMIAALKDMARTVDSGEIATICKNLTSSSNEAIIETIAETLLEVVGDDLEDMTERKYDREIKKYGTIAAETCVLEVVIKERLRDELTRKEELAFKESSEAYHELIESVSTRRKSNRSRNRDRDDNDRGNRNRNKNRNDRGNRKSNRDRKNDRDGDRNHSNKRDNADGSYDDSRSNSRNNRSEVEVEDELGLEENQIISQDNYALLPRHLRDVPMYYAGLEKLVYSNETVTVATLGDNFKMDYQKHRTDLYLSPNRVPENVGKTAEMVEKDLLEAAQKNVKAFIEKPVDKNNPEKDNITFSDFAKVQTNNVTLEGVYEMDLPLFGAESMVRQGVSENLGKDNLNEGVVSVAIRQVIGFIPVDFINGKDAGGEQLVTKFKATAAALVVGPNFSLIKDLLEIGSNLLQADGYESLHRVVNQAVCDAITVSAKVSVKTESLLNDWDGIIGFIDSMEKEDPNIGTAIMTNAGWALPTISIVEDKVTIIRNYIFLPFSKNELTFASTTRYGTIDPSNKKELFEAVDKMFEINQTKIGYAGFTTLVTSDNGLIYVIPNKSLTKHKGYYLTKEI